MKKVMLAICVIGLTLILSGCSQNVSRTDGGLYMSNDFGKNWQQRVFIAQTEKGTQTIANVNAGFLEFDPKDEDRIYFISRNNGIFKTDNYGQSWTQTSLGSGGYASMAIDSLNNSVLYVTQGTKILKTVDGMESWRDTYIEKRPREKIVSVLVSPFQSSVLYAATTNSIIKSFDYGNSWELLDWNEPKINKLFISKKNSRTLFAWTSAGIMKSTNGADDWFDISEPLTEIAKGYTVLTIDFDPRTEHIIIGTNKGIFRTLDGGATWAEVPTLFDFNKVPTKAVTQNDDNTNEILFSVDNIIYRTDDAGRTWTTLKTMGTSRTINYLAFGPFHENVVWAGTLLIQ